MHSTRKDVEVTVRAFWIVPSRLVHLVHAEVPRRERAPMQSAVAPMGAWVAQGKWAIVDTAGSDIGRLITFNHEVLYCSETHPNSPSIEQVYWPENAILPVHHRNFVGREFKSQRRARWGQEMHGDDDVTSVGLYDLDIVLRQNHL